MVVNIAKTKHMKPSAAEERRTFDSLVIEDCVFEGARKFKYLEIIVKNSNKVSDEIHQKLVDQNKIYFLHNKLFGYV